MKPLSDTIKANKEYALGRLRDLHPTALLVLPAFAYDEKLRAYVLEYELDGITYRATFPRAHVWDEGTEDLLEGDVHTAQAVTETGVAETR